MTNDLDILECNFCRHISALVFACFILGFIFVDMRNLLALIMVAGAIMMIVHTRFEVEK
jgi:hypothetical protein